MAVCTVTGTIVDGSGAPIVDCSVRAHPRGGSDDPVFDDGGNLVSDQVISAKTDGNGYFSLNLIRSLTYVIDIYDANYHKQVTIPNEATVDLKDL